MKRSVLFLTLFVQLLVASNAQDQEIEKLIREMTLKEKIQMLGGDGTFNTYGVPRLNIPPFRMTDGPMGIANATLEVGPKATAFPSGLSLAATWNQELVEKTSQAISVEAKSIGKNMLLAPCVNIQRAPHGGRNFESYSEDPFLAARMTESYIQGVQSQNVIATVKHFALNNQETDRLVLNVKADSKIMDEIYFPAFKAAVDAGVGAVMSSYNKVNGTYASENKYLLTDKLKNEWGFQGIVVSDWGATYRSDTATAVLAGLDLEMPWHFIFSEENMNKAIVENRIDLRNIDEMIRRQLKVMKQFGLLSQSNKEFPLEIPLSLLSEHRKIAYESALESIVLLKNEENILPLSQNVKSVALLGPNSKVIPHSGAGSARVNPYYISNIEEELKKQNSKLEFFKSDTFDVGESVSAAKQAEVAILFLGFNEKLEGEAQDRRSLALPADQIQLLNKVKAVQKNIIVVLSSGGMLTMNTWNKEAKAILQLWYPGQEGAAALASLLFGNENPSAKLPISFLQNEKDSWAYSNFPGDGESVSYKEGAYVGYRYLDKFKVTPLYPFGYGLSYSKFRYKNPTVNNVDSEIEISVNLKNTSHVDGKEVVQFYVQTPRFEKELVSFKKVFLKAGEEKIISTRIPFRHDLKGILVGGLFVDFSKGLSR